MSSSKLKVFLCHSSADKPIVRELYSQLSDEGWMDVWLDEESLYPGQDWDLEIEKAVEDAHAILVCLSNNSITKEGYVQHELRVVLNHATYKPDGTVYIIPVRLEDCNLPRQLKHWQYADYFEKDRGRAYQRLLASLRIRAHSLEIPAVTPELKPTKREEDERQVAMERDLAKAAEKEKRERLSAQEVNSKKSTGNLLYIAFGGFVLLSIIVVAFIVISNLIPPATPAPTQVIATTDVPAVTQTPTPALSLRIGSTKTGNDGATLLYVPEGEFTMGSDKGNPDEKPIHKINLSAFWIDKTEATNAMYAKCVQDGKCGALNEKYATHYKNPNYANHPVVYVTWNNAKDYCQYAGRRLPTEAEWEKAARGRDQRVYPWGNGAPSNSLLNYNNYIGNTKAVGFYLKGASFYGALDMAGNVWEWVSSLDKPYPYDASDGRENLISSEARVVRGGSWKDDFVRASDRYKYTPSNFLSNLGFRCASSQ
jgi:formylglycine-generating enzyme required for sulfatase activity